MTFFIILICMFLLTLWTREGYESAGDFFARYLRNILGATIVWVVLHFIIKFW